MPSVKKIDDDELLEMYHKGIMQKDIAVHFKVSPVAICNRLKRLLPQPETVLDNYNLTEKERSFVIEKAQGRSNTQAVLASQYEAGSLQSAKVLGSQLMDKPEVRQAIDELMEIHGLGRSYRIQRLKHHVDHRDPNVSLKALDMSFKLDNSYPPARNINLSASTPIEPVDIEVLQAMFANNDEDDLQK